MTRSRYQSDRRRGGTGAIPSAADVERYEAEVHYCVLPAFFCLLSYCVLRIQGGPLSAAITTLLGDDAHKLVN